MTAIEDTIAAELAALVPAVAPAAAPFGYGEDLDCVGDLTAAMRTISGPRAVLQAIVRRWTTPRGALIDDLSYGEDARRFLNRGTTLKDLAEIEGRLTSEALKDERLEACTLRAVVSLTSVQISGTLTLVDETQPFNFAVSITSAEAVINGA
jgi:hypothetical protein